MSVGRALSFNPEAANRLFVVTFGPSNVAFDLE